MSFPRLIDSMSNQEGSSAGALPTSFMKLCNQGSLKHQPGFREIKDEDSTTFSVEWTGRGAKDLFTTRVSFLNSGQDWLPRPELAWRLIAHRLLDELPDPALPETMEELGNIFVFYSEREIARLSVPLLHRRGLPALRGDTSERPVLSATEE